jgi:Mg2+ and Co2+ transporter CorA
MTGQLIGLFRSVCRAPSHLGGLVGLPAELRTLLPYSITSETIICRRVGVFASGRAYNATQISRQPFSLRGPECRVPKRAHSASWRSPARPFSRSVFRYQRQDTHWNTAVGAEPGLVKHAIASGPETADEPNTESADIRIIDYSDDRFAIEETVQPSLQAFLKTRPKPDWATCRWIYINGLNKEVVHTLGLAYNLHPLALEDVVNTDNPTKIDWYDNHCLMELTLQKLVDVVEQPEEDQESHRHGKHGRRFSYAGNAKDTDLAQQLDKPGRHFYERFDMSVEQVSIFLTTENTVITIFERSGQDVFTPLFTRLQSHHTILRSSNDPSMLVQGVIDAVVDISTPVCKAFGDAFTELELSVLTLPTITQSRQVYVLRAGLTSFLDLLQPIGSLVKALCEHRDVTLSPRTAGSATTATNTRAQDYASKAVSPMAKAYLRDVQDHITTLTNRTRMTIRSAENLTSLIFNTIAAKQNESVRQLTIVSIFFLPLTFLTGYFGEYYWVNVLDPQLLIQ